jgi:hypothetical protein
MVRISENPNLKSLRELVKYLKKDNFILLLELNMKLWSNGSQIQDLIVLK